MVSLVADKLKRQWLWKRFTLVLKTNCLRGSWIRLSKPSSCRSSLLNKHLQESHTLPSKAWSFPWQLWYAVLVTLQEFHDCQSDDLGHKPHWLSWYYSNGAALEHPVHVLILMRFWSWKLRLPGRIFLVEKWSLWTHFVSKNGPPLEIWSRSCKYMQIRKTVSGIFNTCKEVFALSTAPTVPHILFPISLTGWEVLPWDSGRC